MFTELDWEGRGVFVHRARAQDAWIFVAMHDDSLGVPTGGTRMKVYAAPGEGLVDAQRLAAGMTFKWAAVELPFGGGKAVLALSRALEPEERRALLATYGHLLRTLAGTFATGQDLGTTPEDMAFLARFTPAVHGVNPKTKTCEDPGPYTALGVVTAMQSACEQRFETADLKGRSVLVQGVGDVGAPLARQLAEKGARLLLADTATARVASLARELETQVVGLDDVYTTRCDVYAPCAVGATLNPETIPRLACEIVCGSANNQLLADEDSERLHARGILYAPDFIANAGGACFCSGLGTGVSRDELAERVHNLGPILTAVLTEAREHNESPLRAARRRVDRVLASAQERERARSAEGADGDR